MRKQRAVSTLQRRKGGAMSFDRKYRKCVRLVHATRVAGSVCVALVLGCDLQGPSEDGPAAEQAVSWEEFKSSATRQFDGREIYVVEGDLAVSEEELRQRYDAYVVWLESEADEDGIGELQQPSIVNQIGWEDDIWRGDQPLNLTYCVSNAFGAAKPRAVSEMAQATAAWERVARVNFNYVPAQDGFCNNTNPNVVFSVVPWTGGGACAFFPSGGGCVPRTLVIDFANVDSWGGIAPNVRSVGVFRHELGHILGLRHEHTRPESICLEDNAWRPLTGYDRASVMHYPWCAGVATSDLSITSSDAFGASRLYGGSVGNLAAGRAVSQSSTLLGADAARAVDRNIDGNWFGNSVTHTDFEVQPWWQVDLGTVSSIGQVVLFNRTDCCSERLADLDVLVSNDGITWQIGATSFGVASARKAIRIDRRGRFVRIRLRGTNYLSLAEVQVFEPSNVFYRRQDFGGNIFAQDFFYTTPDTCLPGFIRSGIPETQWNSNLGGFCQFNNWLSPDPRDCRAVIHAHTGGGWFGGSCRSWVRQTPLP
jgi:hypothetical protein